MIKKLLKVLYKFIRTLWFNFIINICSLSLWFYIFIYSHFTFQFEHKVVNYLVLILFFSFLSRLCLWVQNTKTINPLCLFLFNSMSALKFFLILKKNPSEFIYIKKKHIFYDYDPIFLKDLPVINNTTVEPTPPVIISPFDADMQTVLIVGGVILGVLIIGVSWYLLYPYLDDIMAAAPAPAPAPIAPAAEVGPADELVATEILSTYFTSKYYFYKIFCDLSIF